MSAPVACFDAPAFQRLVAGQLSAAEVEAVAAHLESCERCAGAARALPDDSVTEAVRAAARLPARDLQAASFRSLIAQVLQLRSGTSSMHGASLDKLGSSPLFGTSAPAVAGTTLGRYRIVRELGRGGMGTVYEAEDLQLRRRIALKVPHFSGSADRQTQLRQRFLREARAAAAVDHPNVCKIYDVGEQDSKPFVVMAFVAGASLADWLAKQTRVNERYAVALTLRIGEALQAVHVHGIVHRDLKPDNILLSNPTTPILTDFGLAHVDADPEKLTGEGAVLGTPAYMAPEQALPDLGAVTVRTDVYSLGVVLFRMLTGRVPVEGGLVQIVGHHIQRKTAAVATPVPSKFRTDLDPALDAIVGKATALRPEERYADVSAFATALKDWLQRTAARPASVVISPVAPSVTRGSTVVVPPPLPASPRRRRWVAAAVLVLGGVGLALGGVLVRDRWWSQPARDEKSADASVPRNDKEKDRTGLSPVAAGANESRPQVLVAEEAGKVIPAAAMNFLAAVPQIDEDFSIPLKNQKELPDGWNSDAFRVTRDTATTRACLEVSKAAQGISDIYFVTLPPVRLSGNFSLEGEYSMGLRDFGCHHKLTLRLESGKGSLPLLVVIDYTSAVTINDATASPLSGYDTRAMHRFRVTREGNRIRVWLDGKIAAVTDLDKIVEYDTLRIGMIAGPGNGGQMQRLYSFKVTPLAPQ